MRPSLRRSLSFSLSASGLALLMASGCQTPAGDPDPAPITVRRSAATAGPRTSPFEPDKESDRNFVTDASGTLDTGCIYRSSGPIEFDIGVTRYLGPLNPDGTLANADALIEAGVLGPTATLTMPGYDVDSSTVPSSPDVLPEADRVLFNGEPIGFLSGVNNVWKLNSFEVDIHKVRFPARARVGESPVPANNHVTIHIDVANAGEDWCTSIDWGALAFRAASPVILVHGNNSNGGFFARQGLVTALTDRHLLVDNSINMATDSVARHAQLLDQSIPAIAKSLGVDSVHLVAHSKGGLDVREYLALYQPQHDKQFKVLSYTTLSTPHNGSVLADLSVQRDVALDHAAEFELAGFPTFTETILNNAETDNGVRDLTTAFAAGFNRITEAISPAIVFNTVAADADLNGNGEIDRSPDEYRELRDESPELQGLDAKVGGSTWTRWGVNAVYQILRHTQSVGLRYETRGRLLGGTKTVAVLTANPTTEPLGNDVLVTIPSGQGEGSIASRVANTLVLSGSAGRNHSNVASGATAPALYQWLIGIEHASGDLQ